MKRVNCQLQEKFVEFLDKLVELELYPSRNEAIRLAVKDFIAKESIFLSNLNSDTKKLSDLHRKFVDFDRELKEELFPAYIPKRESNISIGTKQ